MAAAQKHAAREGKVAVEVVQRLPRYFFFLAAFLGAVFFAALLGAFLPAAFLAAAGSAPFFPPKTRSQFDQNSGVVPVRTIGPPITLSLLDDCRQKGMVC